MKGFQIWRDLLNKSVPDSCCWDPTPGCGVNLFSTHDSSNFHLKIVLRLEMMKLNLQWPFIIFIHDRGCMPVLEQHLANSVSPILRTYFIGTLCLVLIIIISVTIACAAAVELSREYDVPFDEDDDGCAKSMIPGYVDDNVSAKSRIRSSNPSKEEQSEEAIDV